jgi:hypothetical protein
MSIAYSGSTLINNTYISDGTQSGMQSWLTTQLEAAGWSVYTGSGNDVTLVSATTPQGLKIYFRFYNPATGNCIQITMKSLVPALTSQVSYLLPASGVIYRIVANKYQFFIFASGTTYKTTARYNMMGGVPWVPASVATSIGSATTCGWMQVGGTSDTDTNSRPTFRYTIGGQQNWYKSTIWRGSLHEDVGQSDAGLGVCLETRYDPRGQYGIWADGSLKTYEAFIGWLDSSLGVAAICGQLWDAIVVGSSFVGEATYTFDSHTYMVITDMSAIGASLLVAVS